MLVKDIVNSRITRGFAYSTVLQPNLDGIKALGLSTDEWDKVRKLQWGHFVSSIVSLILVCALSYPMGDNVFYTLFVVLTCLVAMSPALLNVYYYYVPQDSGEKV